MASLADAGLASSADLAGGVTVGVASLAVAGVASPADAGVASLADLAGDVTVGVASLADAGVAFLADLAGNVAGGVTSLADPVSVVTFLEGCGVQSESIFVGADGCDNGPYCFVCDEPGDFDICQDMTFLTEPVNVVSPGVTYHESPDVLVGSSVYEYDYHGGNLPDYVDCAEPDDFDGYPDVTFPPELVDVVTDGMTYQEKIDILSGSVMIIMAIVTVDWTILIMMNRVILMMCMVCWAG